jgi:hypothetical protein
MESEGPSLRLKEPGGIGTYPEPNESNAHPPVLTLLPRPSMYPAGGWAT